LHENTFYALITQSAIEDEPEVEDKFKQFLDGSAPVTSRVAPNPYIRRTFFKPLHLSIARESPASTLRSRGDSLGR
jgi:hypothetical protein